MAENSKIEWCDHTVNLWWGCSKVHTGCKNCYALEITERFSPNESYWGGYSNRKPIKSAFKDLDKYQKKAEKSGVMLKIFIGSMMDIFEKPKELSVTSAFQYTGDLRQELFNRIDEGKYTNLIFLFLTKRPENIVPIIPGHWRIQPPINVWFGVSISNKETSSTLNMFTLSCYKKWNLFLSIEPQTDVINKIPNIERFKWIIQGGESGPNKRPFDLQWTIPIKDLCKQNKIAYFFKQIDKKQPIPEEYLIREFPEFKTEDHANTND